MAHSKQNLKDGWIKKALRKIYKPLLHLIKETVSAYNESRRAYISSKYFILSLLE